MKTIKINWGAGIAAVYIGFVAMILVLVGMSAGQKIDLVTDHYYEEELKFQGKIDKIKRADLLPQPLSWEVTNNGLSIHFPKIMNDKSISGKINLYCPSNDKNDRSFAIASTNNEQFIPFSNIPQGRYKVQFDWKSGETTYWNEGVIVTGK
ncbi:FixH family protein [Dyadobacter pollutisoli]|uniref:FixH family protein n=1 Tax=Dyadobacter pollutisoli TaxID=2910158 RepID=A0A9E8NCG9_9BACT|nr:FixH family protein [Dyadobacter pollutisoli]WAC14075.1 FixH family protein [Dyadobacter pollutisoli]